jgi:hypothetical protein
MKELLKQKTFGKVIKICKTAKKYDNYMKNSKKILDFHVAARLTSKFRFMILKRDQTILFGRRTRR